MNTKIKVTFVLKNAERIQDNIDVLEDILKKRKNISLVQESLIKDTLSILEAIKRKVSEKIALHDTLSTFFKK